MNKQSHFYTHVLPWVLFGIGTAATAAVIAAKCILTPELLSLPGTLTLSVLGLAAGFALILPITRKPTSKKDFFGLKGTMILCWIGCLLVLLTVQEMSWVYLVCLPVATCCISFFALYIPHFICLKDEIRRQEERHSR